MSTEIQNYNLTDEDIKTLIQAGIVPNDTPRSQIAVFARTCKEMGLSPFTKEIYLTGYEERATGKIKYSCIPGINGFRKIAAETGQLAGIDDAIFDLDSKGNHKTAAELQAAGKIPVTATVTAYRVVSGVRCPFTHTAVFKEFSTGKQKWVTMPYQMIGKVAEAFALRKGFGDKLKNLHIEEEMGVLQDVTISRLPENVVPIDAEKLADLIKECVTVEDLLKLYNSHSQHKDYADKFTDRRFDIEEQAEMAAKGMIQEPAKNNAV